jgi:hypothetical protein
MANYRTAGYGRTCHRHVKIYALHADNTLRYQGLNRVLYQPPDGAHPENMPRPVR